VEEHVCEVIVTAVGISGDAPLPAPVVADGSAFAYLDATLDGGNFVVGGA